MIIMYVIIAAPLLRTYLLIDMKGDILGVHMINMKAGTERPSNDS